ncbi:MAG: maleylpyruvate isomerase family mycothiol-dependent enzyme [Mycobacterium sp.]|nr:maleylpyruvate isomerase family mycothiol-dependent enzyme [Mycobacterium sp.]
MSPRNLLRANDERFADVADGLMPEEWAAPSLCTEWNNRDVLAHLVVGCTYPAAAFVGALARHRNFDRANTAAARDIGRRRSAAELLDDFRVSSASPVGVGRYFPARLLLGDHVTHELDILFALGREPDVPPHVLDAVLDTQVAFPNPFVPAYRNSRGLQLVAVDTGWRHGSTGPTVAARAAELISVLGNRPRLLSRLQGKGAERLADRVLSRPSRTPA